MIYELRYTNKNTMEIQDYTDKSFILFGEDTKKYKDYIKEMGGKWNANLKIGPGWVFSNNQKDSVLEWLKSSKENEKSTSVMNKKDWIRNNIIDQNKKSTLSDELIDELIKRMNAKNKYDDIKEYRNDLFIILSTKNVSFNAYCNLDIDKIIEYSFLNSIHVQLSHGLS